MQEKRKTAVVTGASSGVGKSAAIALAAAGWHVIAHGRDPQRSKAAEAEIRAAAAPGARVDMVVADLATMAEAARMAREIAALTDRIDVLLNNAGGVRNELVITADGNEATFAGNHLGHFLLTGRLMPLLRAAVADSSPGSVRIVAVSSTGHSASPPIDWNDLQKLGNFQTGPAYCQAKLANILFTRELAKRLGGEGIVAHAMHPGIVDSNFINHGDDYLQNYMRTRPMVTPEAAADTLVWLATASEPGTVNGLYYHERKAIDPAPPALDDAAAERLWIESEKLIARSGA